MLLELRAENYAVIDEAVASFGAGLNLLTGETGGGKSILIDALALLLGGKASSDVVRHGAEKAVLGCVFESTPGAVAILDANGIDASADDILLRREIAAGGKGRVFINNQPATVAVLRELAPELGLIHTQGETLGSFDQAQQRTLLDRFGGIAAEDVAAAYAAWRATTVRLEELQAAEQDRLRMAELWRFQAKEIEQAQLAADAEDAELETEKRVLSNAEKLYKLAMGAHDLLYESEGAAAAAMVGAASSPGIRAPERGSARTRSRRSRCPRGLAAHPLSSSPCRRRRSAERRSSTVSPWRRSWRPTAAAACCLQAWARILRRIR